MFRFKYIENGEARLCHAIAGALQDLDMVRIVRVLHSLTFARLVAHIIYQRDSLPTLRARRQSRARDGRVCGTGLRWGFCLAQQVGFAKPSYEELKSPL